MTVVSISQYGIDINDVIGKVENYFRETEMMTPATFYDGTKNLKFRLMVHEPVSEAEANRLFNLVLVSFDKYSSHADFWNRYNGYFDLKSYSGDVIYQAVKLVGKDIQLIAQSGDA